MRGNHTEKPYFLEEKLGLALAACACAGQSKIGDDKAKALKSVAETAMRGENFMKFSLREERDAKAMGFSQ